MSDLYGVNKITGMRILAKSKRQEIKVPTVKDNIYLLDFKDFYGKVKQKDRFPNKLELQPYEIERR